MILSDNTASFVHGRFLVFCNKFEREQSILYLIFERVYILMHESYLPCLIGILNATFSTRVPEVTHESNLRVNLMRIVAPF